MRITESGRTHATRTLSQVFSFVVDGWRVPTCRMAPPTMPGEGTRSVIASTVLGTPWIGPFIFASLSSAAGASVSFLRCRLDLHRSLLLPVAQGHLFRPFLFILPYTATVIQSLPSTFYRMVR